MRARGRFEGHVWLRRRVDEPQGEMEPIVTYGSSDLAGLVQILHHDYGLILVFDYIDSHYELRCYPGDLTVSADLPAWAACYGGSSLHGVVGAAVSDYCAIHKRHVGGVFSRTEVLRCVA